MKYIKTILLFILWINYRIFYVFFPNKTTVNYKVFKEHISMRTFEVLFAITGNISIYLLMVNYWLSITFAVLMFIFSGVLVYSGIKEMVKNRNI